MRYDVIVIGAGPAGLSAALTLGRSRRSTLVLDAGAPRNAPAAASHGFLTRDGVPPAELRSIALEQLVPYGVQVREAEANAVEHSGEGFCVQVPDGETAVGDALILATGVRDVLPAIPGLAEGWGRYVHHCPYCHGWECRDEPLAVLGSGPWATHLARLLGQWSKDRILFTDGAKPEGDLGDVCIEAAPVAALEAAGGTLEHIVLRDGRRIARSAAFVVPERTQRSALAGALGCRMDSDGDFVEVDASGRTSVPGVWAVGDMSEPFKQQIVFGAAAGMAAAADFNRWRVFGGEWRHG